MRRSTLVLQSKALGEETAINPMYTPSMKAHTCIQQYAFKFVCIPDPLDTLVSLDTYIARVGDIRHSVWLGRVLSR